jgi:hypothetical protein
VTSTLIRFVRVSPTTCSLSLLSLSADSKSASELDSVSELWTCRRLLAPTSGSLRLASRLVRRLAFLSFLDEFLEP